MDNESVLPEDVDEETWYQKPQLSDPNVDGILVQLPPSILIRRGTGMHRNRQRCRWFSPAKYWGFTSKWGGCDKIVCRDGLALGNAPCTPLGCVELIDRAGVETRAVLTLSLWGAQT